MAENNENNNDQQSFVWSALDLAFDAFFGFTWVYFDHFFTISNILWRIPTIYQNWDPTWDPYWEVLQVLGWLIVTDFISFEEAFERILYTPHLEKRELVMACYPYLDKYFPPEALESAREVHEYYKNGSVGKCPPQPRDRVRVFVIFIWIQYQIILEKNRDAVNFYNVFVRRFFEYLYRWWPW